jgi:hypothetical protein
MRPVSSLSTFLDLFLDLHRPEIGKQVSAGAKCQESAADRANLSGPHNDLTGRTTAAGRNLSVGKLRSESFGTFARYVVRLVSDGCPAGVGPHNAESRHDVKSWDDGHDETDREDSDLREMETVSMTVKLSMMVIKSMMMCMRQW